MRSAEGSPVSPARKIWNAFMWTNTCYFAILGGVVAICFVAVVLMNCYHALSAVLTANPRVKTKKDEEQ